MTTKVMSGIIAGLLEVGLNENGEIVINHPDLKPDENGVGHIVFSPNQARSLARLLSKHADESEMETSRKHAEERRKAAEAIPVDRTARVLADGSPVTPDHREIDPATGQQKGYVVLSPAERAKGYVRPIRKAYVHVGKPPAGQSFEYPIRKVFPGGCGTRTEMGPSIAGTFARDPKFYDGTFCCCCGAHFPLDQFVWEGTTEQVGS